jgi:hypothetical protein
MNIMRVVSRRSGRGRPAYFTSAALIDLLFQASEPAPKARPRYKATAQDKVANLLHCGS